MTTTAQSTPATAPPTEPSSACTTIPTPATIIDPHTSSVLALIQRISSIEHSITVDSPSLPIQTIDYPALPPTFSQVLDPSSSTSNSASGSLANKRSSLINSLTSPSNSTSGSSIRIATTQPNPFHDLLSKFNELNSVWHRLEDDTMRNFFVQYSLWENEFGKKLEPVSTANTLTYKQSVLLTSYEQLLKTAELFNTLHSLLPVLDKQPLPNLVQFQTNISTHHQVLLVQAHHAQKLTEQIENFVTLYNQLMDHISRKFVHWDAQINKWENVVDQLVAKKQERAK